MRRALIVLALSASFGFGLLIGTSSPLVHAQDNIVWGTAAQKTTQKFTEATLTDPGDFMVTSGISGFEVRPVPGANWQKVDILVHSGNGKTTIRFMRLKGPGARDEAMKVYQTLTFLAEKFGVPID